MVLRRLLNTLRSKIKLPKNKYATIALFFSVFILIGYMLGGEQNIIEGLNQDDPNFCLDTIKEYNRQLKEIRDQEEADYEQDLSVWNIKKQSFTDSFNKDPVLWKSECGEGTDCEPITGFFSTPYQANIGGWDLASGNYDYETCLRKCRNRTDCDWVNWAPGNCALKGMDIGGWTSIWDTGIKSDTGMRIAKNKEISGSTYKKIWDKTTEQCAEECMNDDYCHAFARGELSDCHLKHFGHENVWKTIVKNTTADHTFSDNHPYIVSMIGEPKPRLTDYRKGYPDFNIVCQDCRQEIDNVDIDESQGIDIGQNLQCVADITNTNGGNTNEGTTNEGTTNEGTTNEGTTNEGTTNGGNTNGGTTNGGNTNGGTTTNTKLSAGAIVGIVAGVIILCLSLAGLAYFAMSM
jgi:hypothetical protein